MFFSAASRAFCATVSLVSIAASNQASAAEADERPDIVVNGASRDYGVKEVSAIKIDAPLKDIPQTIDVVTEAVIRDQRALSIQDILKNVPGVGFSHGDGQRDQVSIRGFSAIADQFVDGLRDDALYFRDLSNIERVEVIKGPASVLFGRGSSGGLINRITKKPGVNIGEVAVSYGSWDDRRAEADLGLAPEGGFAAFRLTGAIERADSFRDQQFLKREAIAPSASFNLGERTQLLVQGDYLRDRRVTDFGIPAFQGRPVDVLRSTYYGSANAKKDDYSQSRVYSGTATLSHQINDNTSIRNAFRYYDYRLDRQNTLPGSVNETARTVSLNRSTVDRNEHGWFNQLELSHKISFAGADHQLLFGVEVGRQVKDVLTFSASGIATVDLFNPVLPVITTNGTLANDNRGIFNTLGYYVQDLVSIGDHLKALVGARYDRFKQSTDNHLLNIVPGQKHLSRTDTNWSPRAGLIWQPTESQSYYVSWSKSFQPSGEAFSIAANNADIAPEKTTNTEAGAKFNFFDGRLGATVSLFNLRRSGIKAADPAVPTVLIPIGVQRTRGIELTGTLNLENGWRAIAGYAYLNAKIVDSADSRLIGKRATITPRNAANLWVTKDFGDRFGLGAGANYISDRRADPLNTVTLPSYFTMDAMAWYRLGPVTAQVNVTNVFDKHYIVSGHGTSPHLNLPGAPRAAMLTLRYAFMGQKQ
ncbi:TonB-dependent siderophore receptor [Rhizorhapis sp.]|uniref:TonB-dependent receptor n=1 Tax=Rhizorhapis sp. TaxID=1968842 RepID=UPI002B4694A1|nr:TonB-dependent siderophore receptor [Rhizorhapis sp.]HKR16499.1 TonB-dependent siderophore receptor [Rhizorhapis sp.]